MLPRKDCVNDRHYFTKRAQRYSAASTCSDYKLSHEPIIPHKNLNESWGIVANTS